MAVGWKGGQPVDFQKSIHVFIEVGFALRNTQSKRGEEREKGGRSHTHIWGILAEWHMLLTQAGHYTYNSLFFDMTLTTCLLLERVVIEPWQLA